MSSVLTDLELLPHCEAEPATSPVVHYFNLMLDTWVKMKLGGVIELMRPLQKLFFKGTDVTSYPSFNRHFQSAAPREPNLHLSLSQERTYVKHAQIVTKSRMSALDEMLELAGMIATDPYVCLLCNGRIKEPTRAVFTDQLRKGCRVAIFLAERVFLYAWT